jgi:hypothetical protein
MEPSHEDGGEGGGRPHPRKLDKGNITNIGKFSQYHIHRIGRAGELNTALLQYIIYTEHSHPARKEAKVLLQIILN